MRRAFLSAALVVACLGVLVAVAAPAHAATPAIELSRDGVAWAPALAAPLFGDALLVPADTATRSFFIRNNAPDAGYLRLTLRDVSTDNLDYAAALSLRADMPGWPGETVAVSAARPCARLAEGVVLAPGGTTRVDLSALLGQLDGLHGQNGHVAFQIVVSVSGEPLGLGATGCPLSGTAVAGIDPIITGARGFSRATTVHRYVSTASGWRSSSTLSSTGSEPLEPSDPTTTSPGIDAVRVASNTDRFYQEYDAALWLLGALLGATAAWVLRRRSHRAAPERPRTHPKGALR